MSNDARLPDIGYLSCNGQSALRIVVFLLESYLRFSPASSDHRSDDQTYPTLCESRSGLANTTGPIFVDNGSTILTSVLKTVPREAVLTVKTVSMNPDIGEYDAEVFGDTLK